jgi:hypothetical protein
MINLDEFERRLRQPAASPAQSHGDPLAELARLIGRQQDPYRDMFQERAPTDRTTVEQDNYEESLDGNFPDGFEDQLEAEFQQEFKQNFHQNFQRDLQTNFEDIRPEPRQMGPQSRLNAPTPQRPSAAPSLSGAERGLRAERLTPPARPQNLVAVRPANPPARAPGRESNPRQPRMPSLGGNFAAIEAGLRGSIHPEYHQLEERYEPDVHRPDERYAPDFQRLDERYEPDFQPRGRQQRYRAPEPEEDEQHWLDEAQAAAPRPAAGAMLEPVRSRRLLYVTAAIIVLGIAGIGATFALKRSPASPQQIATIKAATSPAKIQAPAATQTDGANAAMQDASVLDKTPQAPPTGVVNRAEQPVDLGQAPGVGGAASVPVPTPPTEAPPWETPPPNPQGTNSTQGQTFGLGGMIQSKKVKTVAVRPDGSFVADDAAPQAPPVTSLYQDPSGGVPRAGTTPKATARVVTTPNRAIVDQGVGAGRDPIPADTTNAPSRPSAASVPKPAKPIKVVKLDIGGEAPAEQSGDAGFAVQLAAPASEAEAHQAIARLTREYQAELGGHQLKLHPGKSGDKLVYRVRAGGLSKPAATKLCESLQAKGGNCFVARD